MANEQMIGAPERPPASQSPQKTTWNRQLSSAFWAPAWLAACLCYSLFIGTRGWDHGLFDFHGPRQTQTALTVYYMMREPWTLAYQTPIMGSPWSMPFEFPLYQGIVAVLCKAFSTPIDQTGRFVSFLFFWLTTIPFYFVLKHLGIERKYRFIFLGLFLISPAYVFWGRTFMIETTALFFAVGYLAAVFAYDRRGDRRWLLIATLAGVLAALTKVTTIATFLIPAGVVMGRSILAAARQPTTNSDRVRLGVALFLLLGAPVLAGAGWTHYADVVKEQNVLAHWSTSKALGAWNYGTLAQRLDRHTWRVILVQLKNTFTQDNLFWLGIVGVLVITRRRWKEAGLCAALFFVAPLIFTNLYYIHDYYQCANDIFLLTALGYVAVGVFEASGRTLPGIVFLVVALATTLTSYRRTYLPFQRLEPQVTTASPFADRLRRETPPGSVLIAVGSRYWGGELPYYAERRAITFPDTFKLSDEDILTALTRLKAYPVGALIFRPSRTYQRDHFEQLVAGAGLHALHVYFTDDYVTEVDENASPSR